jgi:6-phosphofructokinase 1
VSKTIAILTSGGDSPGMNAAVRAATMVAVAKGHHMLGVRHGYRGLLDEKIAPIGADDVNGILREGGTILHSARSRRLLSNPAEANGWPVQCIGIPASIDNDIALTGLAIGVDTAMNTISTRTSKPA